MGLFSKLLGRIETRSTGANDYLGDWGLFGPAGFADSGVQISESNALICSTVWACVSVIAQTISTLPVHVVARSDGAKQYDHPLHKLLTESPNEFMTPAIFRETFLANALLWGGGYAAITRDELGNANGLYPVRSSDVRPNRRAGVLSFSVRVGNNTYELAPDQILFLLGWTLDGITPISPIRSGSQTVGLAVAMERYAAKAFSGANVGGILQTPPMNPDAMKNFVESWKRNYVGLDAAFKVAVMPDPMKFIPTTLKPQEGQLIEARQAQVIEICRMWKVPPSMLGLLEKSSYSSLEQQNMSFLQQTILPWLVKLEQELNLKCFLERERPLLEVHFNADAMLRASTQERYAAYQVGRQAGFLTVNDIRRKEGLPPVAGGDVLLQPLNMTPVGSQPDKNAARAILEDTLRRVLTKESKALVRAAKRHKDDPAEFRRAAATFYDSHAELVARTVGAPFKAAGVTVDPKTYAERHVAESRAKLENIQPEEIEDWPECRAAAIAEELLNGDDPHAAAA